MYVVKTSSQLMEAVRESAREIMVVGRLAPKILELSRRPNARNYYVAPKEFSFGNLLNNFNIHAVYDSSQNLIATVFQQRSGQQA